MSESIRELVVSLSLNSDNFSRNIKTINQQIREAESTFKLAGAGVDNFENSIQGAQAKLQLLENKLTQQQRAVEQYSRAFDAANKKLNDSYARHEKLEQKLTAARTAMERSREAADNAKVTYTAFANVLGETDKDTIEVKEDMEAAERAYASASAEVKKLEGQIVSNSKTLQNNADAVSRVQTNLNNANAAMKNTQAAIKDTNQQLLLSQNGWDAAGKAIEDSEAAITTIGKQLKLSENSFALSVASLGNFGKKSKEAALKLELLGEKVELQKKTVSEYEKTLEAATRQLNAAQAANDPDKIKQATDAVLDAQIALTAAKTELKNLEKELKTASSAWTKTGKTLNSVGDSMEKAGKKLSGVGRTLSTIATTPIVALGTTAIKASLDFESSFTSVRKTVDATEEEFEELAAASKKMSTEVAASTTDINEVMATGGQLGIATDGLAEFTRTMIDLGNSCEDLSATDAATTLAKFMNIMGTDQSNVSNIGSTIVDLGNNFATTEAEIMTLAQRLAGAGKQVGLTEAQILGFATALSSVGINAEAGGTAFSKALTKMEVAAATGGQALDDFAKVSNMTADEFKALWNSDPVAAFQAFIEGLAQLDEEGESAIAVLDEIGISEVRLRDTLLRSVNATDLFTRAQDTANKAWEENTALSEEANKRYATTESRLKNLKNTAVLFGQRIGDDLNPTINNLIDGANGLLEKFMALDEEQRMQIIQFAAVAAASGPVISILGKLSSSAGNAVTSIGKFATTVGEADGGLTGLVTVLAKSPTTWFAVTAAVATGTIALLDYVTGAKAAREALESMVDVAERMKETQATTIYDTGSGDPLSRFGLSKEDFTTTTTESQNWIENLIRVWSDGEKETDEIVSGFSDSFTQISDDVRDKINKRGNLLEGLGTMDDTTRVKMEADLAQLDAWDAEIDTLLKKRQNGTLSEEDQTRLNEVIKLRAQLELEYSDGSGDGYDQILQKMQAEIDRMLARGQGDNADPSLYADTLNGLAEGHKAYNEALDESYDAQHAQIMAIEDEAQRTAALAALNEQYNEQRLQGEQAYQQAVAQAAQQAWEATGMDAQLKALDELAALLGSGETDLSKLSEWTSQLDEGKMASMVALAEQLAATGDPESVKNLADIRSKIQQITELASSKELEGLSTIFGEALPEEILRVTAELDMEGATETWNNWIEGKDTLVTTNTINIQLTPLDQTEIDNWESENIGIELTGPMAKVGVMLGAGWQGELQTAFEQGILQVYGTDGVLIPVTPAVLAALDGNDIIAMDADGTYHLIITPELGSTEGVNAALAQMGKNPAEGTIVAPLASSTQADIDQIQGMISTIDEYQKRIDELKQSGNVFDDAGFSVSDYEKLQDVELSALSQALQGLSDVDLTNIAGSIVQLMSALNNGNLDEDTAADYAARLQQMLDVITAADQYTATGTQVSAGIAEGMNTYGWSGDAGTVAASIRAAIDAALGVASPAKTMIPSGTYTAAGIAQGMTEYSFDASASTMAANLLTATTTAISGTSLRTAGVQAMNGLKAGIIAGRSGVITAMRAAARAAVNAAKQELEIHSPSRVFRDEVGAMTMKGFGEGVLAEGKKQAATIRNAARYLTGEAKNGSVAPVSSDNRRTYNNDNRTTFSFAGANFTVRSEQDVHDLAVELATLTRQNQRGKGG